MGTAFEGNAFSFDTAAIVQQLPPSLPVSICYFIFDLGDRAFVWIFLEGFSIMLHRIWDLGFGVSDRQLSHGCDRPTPPALSSNREREIFIENLLVRIRLIIEMILVYRPCAMKV